MSDGWIDVSVGLRSPMPHWPGDEPFRREQTMFMEKGDRANLSQVSMSVHTGTHMDAPLHFVRDGAAMDTMPIEATIGPARVIEIDAEEAIRPEHLAPHDLREGVRVLLKTRNSALWGTRTEFYEEFVYISHAAARYLVERRVRTVGVDYLSVGGFKKDSAETHVALLEAGIWVVEGLDLSRVEAGLYELVCLPLKIVGSEGAPARAVLRKAVPSDVS